MPVGVYVNEPSLVDCDRPCVGFAISVVETLSGRDGIDVRVRARPLSAITFPVIVPKFGPLKVSGCATAGLSTDTTRTYEVATRLARSRHR